MLKYYHYNYTQLSKLLYIIFFFIKANYKNNLVNFMEYYERFSLYLFIYFAFNTINHIDNFNIILLFLSYTIFFFPGACVQDSDFFISGAFVNYLFIFCPNNKFISRIRSRDGISYSLQNQMPRDSQDFALHTTPVFANVYANRLADGISFGAIA